MGRRPHRRGCYTALEAGSNVDVVGQVPRTWAALC